jgi:hypothetical protein
MSRPAQKMEKRKPYQAPKLLVYGDLSQMTQASGKKGKSDNATRGGNRQTGR